MQEALEDNRGENLLFNNYFISMMERIFDPIPICIIVVDKDTRVKMINKAFADYLGFPKHRIIGEKVLDIDKNSRWPYVFQKKQAEIAWKHTFENGHTAIVHRIPVLDEHGDILYGFGMVLFEDVEQFREIVEKNRLLETTLDYYRKELQRIKGAKYSFNCIIGNSTKMKEAKGLAQKAAATDSNVLLLGESGTGKELFAHAIHNAGGRRFYPFIKVNCAAIPSELLESELFGYEEGAFTGAKKGGKAGKFLLANKGTIFLDEIGDMPEKMQAKLLRVLQEKEIEPVGSTETKNIDVRLITATNKNLEELVEKGQFREDLYYRLNVLTIKIPPLRERTEDIDHLCEVLIKKISERVGKYVTKISKNALDIIKSYKWPGNVRQLENVLERAIILSNSCMIDCDDLPDYIKLKDKRTYNGPIKPMKDIIEEVEKEAIIKALEYTKGNKFTASKLLGISRSSLYEKMNRYGISIQKHLVSPS
ncbi:Transcriptional regulatory protein ZraR [Koleobacter methoxysyntrophicus]|uniref:Transcriptional regulatory protein ZraR n=1 Tax=Koleobacter methoxysyntrophicus TaxID=2751313 RepID=A0A8A0RHV2_9FIRM|nr:sigma 54-interacting transcriptional regulator [Koleobacter methoxysyntrophicus]QSQ08051.1 Transcriptional regulatory protein ZraR [Koleobacter methoxysyntrophicus]